MNLNQFEKQILHKVRSNKVKTRMSKANPYQVKGQYEFKMDRKLKQDLDILCDDLDQNDDALIIIVAPEGSGKTVLETQIGYYISQRKKTSWGVDNIHFDGQGFIDFGLNNPAKIVNCLDESRRALNKMRGMTGNNVDFMNYLSECRDQNQVGIVVLPAYSDLEQYVAIHRVKYVIQVIKRRDEETKRLIRGTYRIIDAKSKSNLKQAWKNGYKEFPRNMIVKECKFDNVLCLDEKEYNKKKTEAKKERYGSKEDNKPVDPLKQLAYEHRQKGKTYEEIAEIIGKGKSTIDRWVKEYETNSSHFPKV